MTTSYISNQDADAYFSTRFSSNRWAGQLEATKTAVLLRAAIIIDRLNFAGLKAAAYAVKINGGTREEMRVAGNAQVNQFPRGSDTTVPQEILDACCEIAYALISGIDPDEELRALATASESIGPLGLKVTYDKTRAADWVLAGVPSPTAWQMLLPYLRDLHAISICRV